MILVLFLTVGGGFLEARGQNPEKTHEASAANEKTYSLAELQKDFGRLRSAVEEKHEASAANEKTYSLAELQEDFGRLRSVIERKYSMYSSLGLTRA